MKKIVLVLIFASFLFGAEPATKDDIQMILKMMEVNQDAVNKRFDSMQQQMDKRFDAVDKRFEAVDKRFEAVDKRFEAVDKRFETMQQQINTTNDYILGLMVGIFGLIGFMMWDRRTVVERAKKETEMSVEKIIEERIAKKADRALLDRILDIIEKLAKDDKEAQELLKKHRMTFA